MNTNYDFALRIRELLGPTEIVWDYHVYNEKNSLDEWTSNPVEALAYLLKNDGTKFKHGGTKVFRYPLKLKDGYYVTDISVAPETLSREDLIRLVVEDSAT